MVDPSHTVTGYRIAYAVTGYRIEPLNLAGWLALKLSGLCSGKTGSAGDAKNF